MLQVSFEQRKLAHYLQRWRPALGLMIPATADQACEDWGAPEFREGDHYVGVGDARETPEVHKCAAATGNQIHSLAFNFCFAAGTTLTVKRVVCKCFAHLLESGIGGLTRCKTTWKTTCTSLQRR
jgi:hypothetical protein